MRWSDLIGLTVGQYRVIKEIGRGGAARVFRAYDEAGLRTVALKVLPIETDDRAAFMRRFERETKVIRTLDHPNIVQVYDSGETDEFVYIVLRLLEGGTLRQRIATQRLSTQQACQYMIQIAHALHHAHQLGIIHRDVKPSNMLLDVEQPGHILLSDFGTAKILHALALTRTGATVGTPEYMSPEQAEGRDVDQRSDIYSLGCALYETLAGRPPFVGANSVSILYQQVHSQATYIRSYNTDVPPQLWTVLRSCLAKRPEERYGAARILADELQPFADGLIQPTPVPWRNPVTKRLSMDDLGNAPSRPLRDPFVTPDTLMPPPFTPAPTAVTPEMPGSPNGLLPGQHAGQFGPSAPGQVGGSVGPLPMRLDGERAQTSRPISGQRGGARTTLRLPTNRDGSRGSGLLSGALTSEEGRALAAFEAQNYGEQTPTQRHTSAGVHADAYQTLPTPTPGQRAQTSAPLTRGATSRPMDGAVARGATSRPMDGTVARGATSRPMDGTVARGATSRPMGASQYASNSAGRPATTSKPRDMGGSWNDDIPDSWTPRPAGKRRRSRLALISSMTVAALLIVVALGLGGIRLFAQQGAHSQLTLHPTATSAPPTATPTTALPTVTATPNAQQALNSQAAHAFRAITLTPASDGSCASGAMTTAFGDGSPVYVNLCMANVTPPGPVTVEVRQNGAVVRTLIAYLYVNAGSVYTQGHTLNPGSYDMLVTMQINGKQATAQDISFTVK